MSLMAPVVVSGGSAAYGYATIQGQFWGGFASQAGVRLEQNAGAAGQASMWAASQALKGVSLKTQAYFYGAPAASLLSNSAAHQGTIDFVGGFTLPGPPPPPPAGYAGFGASRIIPKFHDE